MSPEEADAQRTQGAAPPACCVAIHSVTLSLNTPPPHTHKRPYAQIHAQVKLVERLEAAIEKDGTLPLHRLVGDAVPRAYRCPTLRSPSLSLPLPPA